MSIQKIIQDSEEVCRWGKLSHPKVDSGCKQRIKTGKNNESDYTERVALKQHINFPHRHISKSKQHENNKNNFEEHSPFTTSNYFATEHSIRSSWKWDVRRSY